MNWYTPLAVMAFCIFFWNTAFAHDPDCPECDAWYASLMQPDNPTVSCCGEADAYWCDPIHVREEEKQGVRVKITSCTINDPREDAPLHNRVHVPIGTVIDIPDYKLKWDKGNPTGHAIVFLSRMQYVYCFVQDGGV